MEHVLLYVVGVAALVVYVTTAVTALAWYRHAQEYKRLHASACERADRYRDLYHRQSERARRWKHAALLEGFRR